MAVIAVGDRAAAEALVTDLTPWPACSPGPRRRRSPCSRWPRPWVSSAPSSAARRRRPGISPPRSRSPGAGTHPTGPLGPGPPPAFVHRTDDSEDSGPADARRVARPRLVAWTTAPPSWSGTCARATGTSRLSAASISRSTAARCSPCPGPPARARPPRSRSCRVSAAATTAPWTCWARIPPGGPGVAGQDRHRPASGQRRTGAHRARDRQALRRVYPARAGPRKRSTWSG